MASQRYVTHFPQAGTVALVWAVLGLDWLSYDLLNVLFLSFQSFGIVVSSFHPLAEFC